MYTSFLCTGVATLQVRGTAICRQFIVCVLCKVKIMSLFIVFLTLALDRGEWSASCLGCLVTMERSPSWAPDLVWVLWRTLNLVSLPVFHVSTLWPNHCTDYTVQACFLCRKWKDMLKIFTLLLFGTEHQKLTFVNWMSKGTEGTYMVMLHLHYLLVLEYLAEWVVLWL
jgi:hypothetical protein